MTPACRGNVCGCDMSMGAPVSTGKPHCKRWQRSERPYYKDSSEVLLWPLVAHKQLAVMLHERLAVTKSSCRNMLMDIALHRTTVKVKLSYKDMLEAEHIAEMQYKTFCQCQFYMSV